jgi:hypothetical protein
LRCSNKKAIAIKMQIAIHDQAPPRTFISSADITAIYSLYDFSLSWDQQRYSALLPEGC